MSFKEESVRRIQGERSNLRNNRANVHKSQLTAIVQNLRDLCAHNVLRDDRVTKLCSLSGSTSIFIKIINELITTFPTASPL